MAEWSNSLVAALGKRDFYLRELVGLDENLDGPQFEERLGEFLTMARHFPKTARLMALSTNFPGMTHLSAADLTNWHSTVQRQMETAMAVIHQSLIDNFGWERIDGQTATSAYSVLLKHLGIQRHSRMVYVTTNYDYLGEWALERLGRRPEPGVRRPFNEPGVNTMQVLDMENLVETVGRGTPVLHLHGGVGWFQQDGQEPTIINTKQYDASWGTPIVMLPSIDKDYQAFPIIDVIWQELTRALRRARRVLVLGHSMNDQSLLQALIEHVQPYDRIAITVLPDQGTTASIESALRRLNGATALPLRFESSPAVAQVQLTDWHEAVDRADNE